MEEKQSKEFFTVLIIIVGAFLVYWLYKTDKLPFLKKKGENQKSDSSSSDSSNALNTNNNSSTGSNTNNTGGTIGSSIGSNFSSNIGKTAEVIDRVAYIRDSSGKVQEWIHSRDEINHYNSNGKKVFRLQNYKGKTIIPKGEVFKIGGVVGDMYKLEDKGWYTKITNVKILD